MLHTLQHALRAAAPLSGNQQRALSPDCWPRLAGLEHKHAARGCHLTQHMHMMLVVLTLFAYAPFEHLTAQSKVACALQGLQGGEGGASTSSGHATPRPKQPDTNMLQRGTLNGGLATHASPNCTHPPRCSHLVASMGGRGGFGDPGLILGPNGSPMGRPGAPGGPPNRLIIPGGQGRFSQQQRAPVGLPVDDPSSSPGQLPPAHKYRPPPGFMGDNVQDPALNQTDPQEMISKLR